MEKGIDKAKEKERDLLESRSQHMRKYLMDKVIPVLAEGVLKLCKELPDEPIDYLVRSRWFIVGRFLEPQVRRTRPGRKGSRRGKSSATRPPKPANLQNTRQEKVYHNTTCR